MNCELIIKGYIIVNAILLVWYLFVPNDDKDCKSAALLLFFGIFIGVGLLLGFLFVKIGYYFVSELRIIPFFKVIFTKYYNNIPIDTLIRLNNDYKSRGMIARFLLKLINKRNNYDHI